jgi:Fe-S cluster biogenesis protein NfuA
VDDRVEDVVDRLLRPLIAADGGPIEVTRVGPGVVVIRLGGTCNGCPGAPFTRSRVIERALRTLVSPDLRIEFEHPQPSLPKSNPGTAP